MKILSLGLGAVLLLAAVSGWAAASPISDTLAISGTNGAGQNCGGGPFTNVIHDVGGKETPAGVNVVCKGNYNFGLLPGGQPSDNLRYGVTATFRSKETKVEIPQADLITITIVGISYPDTGPGISDSLTVTITDTLHLYNFSQTVLINELANGKDSPNPVVLILPNATHNFPLEGGQVGDSITLNGSIQLQSFNHGVPDTGLDTTTEVITILATSDAPEPSTLVLLGTSIVGIAGLMRRRFRK